MARRLSRRALAHYVANGLLAGKRSLVIRQLAGYLIEYRRTKELALIVRDVQYLLSQNGIVIGTMTSAFDLTAETKKAIEKFVKTKTSAKEVSLESLIDPSVLGGVKVSLPGQEIDQTVAHQLTVLKTRYRKA